MDIRLPDGTILQNIPEGTTRADLAAKLNANGLGHTLVSPQIANDPISQGARNFAQDMPKAQQFAAAMGKAGTDLARGAGQLVGMGPSGQDVAEQRRLDAPLMNTGAGAAGNIAGNLIPALGLSAIPGANTYGGAAAIGGIMGGLNPATSTNERLANMATGSAFGAGGQGVSNAIGRVVKPVQSTLNPEAQRLAGVLTREGVPLDAAQATGSKPLQTINAVFENLPFTAGPEAAKKAAQSEAFTAAALRRTGASGASATPDVLATQKSALGSTFQDISGRNTLTVEPWIKDELNAISQNAARRLANPSPVTNTVKDILADAPSGVMEGTKYQGWREELGRLSRGNGTEAHFFGELKSLLDKTFNAQISGADAEAWKQASRQYANLKTVSQAMGGAGNSAATGQVAPAQLAAALRGAVSKEGVAMGRGDLNDLSRAGQLFVKDQIPNSGTPQRALYQSLMMGAAPVALGAGAGAGAGMATGHDPLQAAAIGAGSLYSPRVIQMLLNKPGVQSYLANGITNHNALALANTLRASALPAALALEAK